MTFDRPRAATHHCRHYSYEPGLAGGPRCKAGVDLTAPGSTAPCMPDVDMSACLFRFEYTDDERATWEAWRNERAARTIAIMALIPGSSRDKKNRPEWGKSGSFPCPACETGTVQWARARSNGHLHAGCSTKFCFGVME